MRLKKLMRNGFFSLLSQMVLLFFGFFSQRAMTLYMGKELVGMNGVVSNVIAILSVSELGISTAIIYHLYSVLAVKDKKGISALMNLYRRAYQIFAVIISVLGLLLLPFIHLFMKDNSYSVSYVRVLYLLWLFRTMISYPLSYKKSLLIADQKEYVVSIAALLTNVLNYSAVIGIVMYSRRYLLALGLNIIVECSMNLWISAYVDRKYPYLAEGRKDKLQRNTVQMILADLKNIFVSRVSLKLLTCTDNLIISGFLSVGAVGLYSNYCLITQTISNIMINLGNTIQPAVGNLFTEKNQERNYQVLRQLTFAFFVVIASVGAGVFGLVTPFVTDIWLGDAYGLGISVRVLCVANCVLQVMGLPLSIVMGVSGMFHKERNLMLFSAAANLVLSLVLAGPLGMLGVLLGTFAAYLIQILYRGVVFFRDYLGPTINGIRYLQDCLEYALLLVLEIAGCNFLTEKIYRKGNLLLFVLCGILCVALPAGCNMALFCKSFRFQSFLEMLQGMQKGRKGLK